MMGVRIGVDREGARQDFYRPSSPLAPLIDIILHLLKKSFVQDQIKPRRPKAGRDAADVPRNGG